MCCCQGRAESDEVGDKEDRAGYAADETVDSETAKEFLEDRFVGDGFRDEFEEDGDHCCDPRRTILRFAAGRKSPL